MKLPRRSFEIGPTPFRCLAMTAATSPSKPGALFCSRPVPSGIPECGPWSLRGSRRAARPSSARGNPATARSGCGRRVGRRSAPSPPRPWARGWSGSFRAACSPRMYGLVVFGRRNHARDAAAAEHLRDSTASSRTWRASSFVELRGARVRARALRTSTRSREAALGSISTIGNASSPITGNGQLAALDELLDEHERIELGRLRDRGLQLGRCFTMLSPRSSPARSASRRRRVAAEQLRVDRAAGDAGPERHQCGVGGASRSNTRLLIALSIASRAREHARSPCRPCPPFRARGLIVPSSSTCRVRRGNTTSVRAHRPAYDDAEHRRLRQRVNLDRAARGRLLSFAGRHGAVRGVERRDLVVELAERFGDSRC